MIDTPAVRRSTSAATPRPSRRTVGNRMAARRGRQRPDLPHRAHAPSSSAGRPEARGGAGAGLRRRRATTGTLPVLRRRRGRRRRHGRAPTAPPQPEAYELAAVHAPIRFADGDARGGMITVHQREQLHRHRRTSTLRWRYEESGRALASGTQPLTCRPAAARPVHLGRPPANPTGAERGADRRGGAEAGHRLGADRPRRGAGQFAVGGNQVPSIASPAATGRSPRPRDGRHGGRHRHRLPLHLRQADGHAHLDAGARRRTAADRPGAGRLAGADQQRAVGARTRRGARSAWTGSSPPSRPSTSSRADGQVTVAVRSTVAAAGVARRARSRRR